MRSAISACCIVTLMSCALVFESASARLRRGGCKLLWRRMGSHSEWRTGNGYRPSPGGCRISERGRKALGRVANAQSRRRRHVLFRRHRLHSDKL